jgi:hypothetical protein
MDASWHRPFGSRNGDEEALGFGHGEGVISGEIEGKVVWANYPRRRQDGVWTPNLRGMIAARNGGELLVSIHGQSVQEDASGDRRAILARIELTTEAEPYRWLNTCFLIGEGEINEGHEDWWLDLYVCVNERAHGPPAIGAHPPERFRQRGDGRAP